MAKEFLEFYSWDYDKEGNIRVEALKKIASKCFYLSQQWNVRGIINAIVDMFEAYIPLDGSKGVQLISIDNFSFDDEEFTVTID